MVGGGWGREKVGGVEGRRRVAKGERRGEEGRGGKEEEEGEGERERRGRNREAHSQAECYKMQVENCKSIQVSTVTLSFLIRRNNRQEMTCQ